ncbi:MAG: sensor histidine kinase [Leptonema sp. (in: bacteria)]
MNTLISDSKKTFVNPTREEWKKEEDRILLRDIFYVFLVLWISIFISEYFFLDSNSTPIDRIFSYIIIFLPLGTLNFLLHYLYRNRKIRITGKLRSSLRYRLILAFLLVSIIPAMPIFLLSSSKVESIVSLFFKLDLKGSMESVEKLLEYHEKKLAENLYTEINLNKPTFLYYIQNLANVNEKQKFFKFLEKWFNETTDAVYIYDGNSLVKIYGLSLIKDKNINPELLEFSLILFNTKKYIFININLQNQNKILFLKQIYKNYTLEESKFRNVYLLLSKGEERFSEIIPYNLRLSLAILYLSMIVIAILVAILLARQISYPIVSLAEATQKVTEGKLDTRLDIKSEGEIATLIQSFNMMTEELQTLRSRLMHSLRVAAWQEVAKRLAHEIKNPLTPIQLSAERMLRKVEQKNPKEINEVVASCSNTIIEQVNVLKHLLEEFSNFTRLPVAKLEPQSIVPLIKESIELFKNIPDIKIEFRYQDKLPNVYLDKNLFIGIMNNLIKNAIEAIKEHYKDSNEKKGVILVSVVEQKKMGKSVVVLRIEDNGHGIPEDMREKIFEPYFSTKGTYGSGLGLAFVERAVMEHNARIQVLKSSLGGAEFRILFNT